MFATPHKFISGNGVDGARSRNLLNASQVLSQLSYHPGGLIFTFYPSGGLLAKLGFCPLCRHRTALSHTGNAFRCPDESRAIPERSFEAR
jgi:hypothetical protein